MNRFRVEFSNPLWLPAGSERGETSSLAPSGVEYAIMSHPRFRVDPAASTVPASGASGPGCLSEAELMPLAHGESAGPVAESHLATCAGCQSRLCRLRAEVGAVRGIRFAAG